MDENLITDNGYHGSASHGQRVVARFRDGRMVKGLTRDFHQGKQRLHVFDGDMNVRPAETILVDELKALFFVKDLRGRAERFDDYSFRRTPGYGRKAVLLFEDREVVAGFTLGHDERRKGFFLVPADPTGNNQRIYVLNRALTTIQFV